MIASCPIGADINKANGWFSPSFSTPDLFNACADLASNLSVPINGFGYQEAYNGNGYAGFVTYGQGTNYREYIATKLLKTLEPDKLYEISFFINLPENSPIASNNLGFSFTADSVFFTSNSLIQFEKTYSCDYVVKDSIEWVKISFLYEANGTERYLFIGNFRTDLETINVVVENSGGDQYYFIDNVFLAETLNEVENVFSPNGDGINDIAFKYINMNSLEVQIIDRWGNSVDKIEVSNGWNGKDRNGNMLNEGVYFYVFLLNKTEIVKTGFIHLIR
jgi:gliding motility-associated-like protein